MNTTPTQVAQNVHAFTQEARDAVYQAIFSRRDVRGQFLPTPVPDAVLPDDLGWCNGAGNVLGVYLHGLFEDPAVLQALFGANTPTLERVFDGLANYIEKHFEAGVLASLIASPTGVPAP